MKNEQAIHFHEPAERKDGGLINYTSVSSAIDNWRQDPYGYKTMRFLNDAYGIDPQSGILEAAGMEEYLQYKQEGRFIGFVAEQILKPSFYYLSNAIILGELAKRGLPTALMVFEYPQDPFLSRNPDKRGALGNVEFYLNEKRSTRIKVNPVGLKNQLETIKTMNEADGFPCQEVLVDIDDSSTALGLNLPKDQSLTEFYKLLWIESINRLRRERILPNEQALPMFFVDMTRLYSTLAAAAHPSPELLDQLLFTREKRAELFRLSGLASDYDDDDLPGTKLHFDQKGLLIQDNGMMDAASYYPLQTAWPDLYLECSSCGGEYFVGKLSRAQQLKYAYGIPEVEVRLPDTEVPDLEHFCLHPTGQFTDYSLNLEWKEINNQIRSLANQMPKLPPDLEEKKASLETEIKNLKLQSGTSYLIKALLAQIPKLSPNEIRLKGELGNQIKLLRIQQEQLSLPPQEYMREVSFSLPTAIEAVYNQLLQGVPEHV